MAFVPSDHLSPEQQGEFQKFISATYDKAMNLIEHAPKPPEAKTGLAGAALENYRNELKQYKKALSDYQAEAAANPFYTQLAEAVQAEVGTGASTEAAMENVRASLDQYKEASFKAMMAGVRNQEKDVSLMPDVGAAASSALERYQSKFSLFSPSTWSPGALLSGFWGNLKTAFSNNAYEVFKSWVKETLLDGGNLDIAAAIKSFKSGLPEMLGGNGIGNGIDEETAKQALVSEQTFAGLLPNGGQDLKANERAAMLKGLSDAYERYKKDPQAVAGAAPAATPAAAPAPAQGQQQASQPRPMTPQEVAQAQALAMQVLSGLGGIPLPFVNVLQQPDAPKTVAAVPPAPPAAGKQQP